LNAFCKTKSEKKYEFYTIYQSKENIFKTILSKSTCLISRSVSVYMYAMGYFDSCENSANYITLTLWQTNQHRLSFIKPDNKIVSAMPITAEIHGKIPFIKIY
jgi:hypothetical protein